MKVETASSLPTSSAPQSPLLSKPYSSYMESHYHAPYPHQPVSYPVPSSTSPDSIGSWSHRKPTAPSPPESPKFYDSESLADDVEYQAFELDAMRAKKDGGSLLANNLRKRRAVQTSHTADDCYRKQRDLAEPGWKKAKRSTTRFASEPDSSVIDCRRLWTTI